MIPHFNSYLTHTCMYKTEITCTGHLPDKMKKKMTKKLFILKKLNFNKQIIKINNCKCKWGLSREKKCIVAYANNEDKENLAYLGTYIATAAGLGGSVGCAVRLETRRSRVQPPPRSATFFRGDWSWNIFYCHSLPSADSRRAVVSFWWKNMHSTG